MYVVDSAVNVMQEQKIYIFHTAGNAYKLGQDMKYIQGMLQNMDIFTRKGVQKIFLYLFERRHGK